MALEMITSIKKAESEAEKIIKEAHADAKQILKDATDRAYRIVSDSAEKSEKEAQSAVSSGALSAEGECKEILENAKREAEALRVLCEPKIEKAVSLIINKIGR